MDGVNNPENFGMFGAPSLVIPPEDMETLKQAASVISETASKLKELNIPSFHIVTKLLVNGKSYTSNFIT
jgi:hypothetical protein